MTSFVLRCRPLYRFAVPPHRVRGRLSPMLAIARAGEEIETLSLPGEQKHCLGALFGKRLTNFDTHPVQRSDISSATSHSASIAERTMVHVVANTLIRARALGRRLTRAETILSGHNCDVLDYYGIFAILKDRPR
jgi:hypothetical protein